MEKQELLLIREREGRPIIGYRNFPEMRAKVFLDSMTSEKSAAMVGRLIEGQFYLRVDIKAELERAIADQERCIREAKSSGQADMLTSFAGMVADDLEANKALYEALYSETGQDALPGEPTELAFDLGDAFLCRVPLGKADKAREFFVRMHRMVLAVFEVYIRSEKFGYGLDAWLRRNHRLLQNVIDREMQNKQNPNKRALAAMEEQKYCARLYEEVYGVPFAQGH